MVGSSAITADQDFDDLGVGGGVLRRQVRLSDNKGDILRGAPRTPLFLMLNYFPKRIPVAPSNTL